MAQLAIVDPELQRVDLSLIGDFEVRCNGYAVEVAPAAQRLVSFLAFQQHPVRRSFVYGSLWFDADEHHASANLRSALWRLNRIDIVRASKTHLWLRPDLRVDLTTAVERAIAALRTIPADDALPGVAWDLLAVGDDILVGWYDDWVTYQRERYRQVRLQALDRIGELLIETDRLYEAFQVSFAAIKIEPLRESAHRLMARVYLQQGNIAEAIRQYQNYAMLLSRELDGTPSPDFRNLLAPFHHSVGVGTGRLADS